MTISLAIDDLVSTITDLADVVEENQEPGSAAFHLTVTLGEQDNDYYFGATGNKQEVVLTLTASGVVTNNEIAAKIKEISDALVADRRRDGNAQTTVVGPWEKSEDEGREGIVFQSTIEVHTYGS